MSAPGMMSPLEEARKKISKDELKESLKLVEEALGALGMEESVRRGYQNTVTVFLARYNRIQKERSIRTPEYYDMQLNGLATDMLELIGLVEEEVNKGSKVALFELSDTTSLVELVVDIDFGERREEQLEEFLTRMATMIRINPGSLTAINKKARGIIVEGTLSTEHILKIKSLVRIGLLEGLESIKGYGVKEEWRAEPIGVYLVDCKLPGVQLPGADLSKADLSKADLSGADLSGANLVGARLNGAKLNKANLQESDLNGADLNEANLSHARLEKANFRGAKLNNANLVLARLEQASFRWADLQKVKFGIKWAKTNLGEADFTGADLREANLLNVFLGGANLSEANLFGANLAGADLSKADLSKANLTRVDLSEAILIDANLKNANLTGVNLTETNLTGANFFTAIFHINQASMLIALKIDTSWIIFLNDQGKLAVYPGSKIKI